LDGAGAPSGASGSAEEQGGPEEQVEVDEQKVGVRPLRAPNAPTKEEIEEHEASGHSNYRSWCQACIVGRGRSDAHKHDEFDEHALPTVAIDYGYLADPGAAAWRKRKRAPS